jgi:alkaline phosphatase D
MHAWWEYMPARVGYDPDGETLQDRFELWRSFAFGDLVDLVLTDERLFRDPPKSRGAISREATAPKYEPPDRTMLGAEQRDWLIDALTGSDATWTVWCDEVLTVPFKLGAGPLTMFPMQGGWDGYIRERRAIKEAVHEAGVENFVTLTGDAHCYIAGYKKLRYDDTLRGLVFGSQFGPEERVGVEFMTPPVTSINVAEALGLTRGPLRDWTEGLLSSLVEAMNPHIELFNSHRWGYSTVEFTREDCVWTAYGVDKTDDSDGADREVVARLRVPAGRPEIQDLTDGA